MIDTFIRAFRGTVRSPIRTLLLVVLLAAGLSFALTSLALSFAADDELKEIKESQGIDAGVIINPDQSARAIQEEFQRSQEEDEQFDTSRVAAAIKPLTTEHADLISSLPYVREGSVEVYTAAAVEYELPDREAGRENDLNLGPLQIALPDAIVTGARDPSTLPDFEPGKKELREGRLFGPADAEKNIIVIDQDTAAFEDLSVGDTIVLKAEIPREETEEGEEPPPEPEFREVEAEIVGIYADLESSSAQTGFTPARIEAWYAPIKLVRDLQDPEDHDTLTKIAFQIDSVDSVPLLKADIAELLDPELYTLTTTEERFEQIADPVRSMRDTSRLGMVAGLGVVALIMVLLMALVVRGRLREIGILKAVGARNRQVILQFALETIGVTVVAVGLAVPLGLATNNLVAEAFRGDAEVEQREINNQNSQGVGGAGATVLSEAPVATEVRTEDVEAVLEEVNASITPEIIGVAAGITVALGLLGAMVPIVAVLRLRPAEVLRLEA